MLPARLQFFHMTSEGRCEIMMAADKFEQHVCVKFCMKLARPVPRS